MKQTKQKILYIITQGAWGGAQRYVFDLATNLYKDFEITIAVGEPEGRQDLQKKIEKLKDYRIEIIQLKHLKRKISPFHDISAIFEIRKLYKQLKPSIIHLNSTKTGIMGSFAKIFSLHSSFFILYTVHGWVWGEPLSRVKRWLYKLLEKITAKFKDKIIILSEYDKMQAIEKLKIKPNKLELIPLGIEKQKNQLSKIEARKKLYNFTTLQLYNSFVVGTIAGLYKTKGIDVLIDAIAGIRNQEFTSPAKESKIKNLQFFIIGDGPEKDNLLLKIRKLHIENCVHFLGYIEDASRFLPAFDLFVLPSRKEGLPYTILEALQAGIPIVATKVGGVSSLIEDKKTGLLVKPDNVEDLKNAILAALDKDSGFFNKTAQPFRLENMVEKTNLLYQLYL